MITRSQAIAGVPVLSREGVVAVLISIESLRV
jgi:hypothetical protein